MLRARLVQPPHLTATYYSGVSNYAFSYKVRDAVKVKQNVYFRSFNFDKKMKVLTTQAVIKNRLSS